jgi:hypothetical protein
MEPLHDDTVIRFLGPRFAGRRYLRFCDLEAIGIVANRASLRSWIDRGAFPRGIRIAGPYGRTLVWPVGEIVKVLADRAAERDASPDNETGTPIRECPSNDSNSIGPLVADPVMSSHAYTSRQPPDASGTRPDPAHR